MYSPKIFKKTCFIFLYASTLLGSTILFLLLGHFSLGIIIELKNSALSKQNIQAEHSPAYEGYHYETNFWQEFKKSSKKQFKAYAHWQHKSHKGKFINTNAGIRKTLESSRQASIKIFLFGGSTMYGHGVKDHHTVASFLQKKLGSKYQVVNYGQSGYVSTQEFNVLLELLAQGSKPNIVIFYDGLNDGYAGAYSPAIPRQPEPHNLHNEQRNFENLGLRLYQTSHYKSFVDFLSNRINGSNNLERWETRVKPLITDNAQKTVDIYEEHIRQVKAIAREYNFSALFFWQPYLFNEAKQFSDFEEQLLKHAWPVLKSAQKQVYLKAKQKFSQRESEQIFFIADTFENVAETMYIDDAHLGPKGNQLIAQEIFKALHKTNLFKQ